MVTRQNGTTSMIECQYLFLWFSPHLEKVLPSHHCPGNQEKWLSLHCLCFQQFYHATHIGQLMLCGLSLNTIQSGSNHCIYQGHDLQLGSGKLFNKVNNALCDKPDQLGYGDELGKPVTLCHTLNFAFHWWN